MQRYTEVVFKRIKQGPRELIDPEQEFILADMEDYLHYKCKEVIKDERYECQVCQKVFKEQHFVIKHIRNKHEDVVNDTYERESTKDWLKRNIQ